MSKAPEIRDAALRDGAWADDFHTYFETLDLDDWCDVADVGEELLAHHMGIEIHPFSTFAGIVSSVSAAAYHAAINNVEFLLGLPRDTLEAVMDDEESWPITFEQLIRKANEFDLKNNCKESASV